MRVLYSIYPFATYGLTPERPKSGPMLTVETEVNGDSKSTNQRGPSLVGSLGPSCHYAIIRDFYPAFASLVSSVQNIFCSPFTISIYVSPLAPIAQQAGRAVVQDRLSLNMCLRLRKTWWACLPQKLSLPPTYNKSLPFMHLYATYLLNRTIVVMHKHLRAIT